MGTIGLSLLLLALYLLWPRGIDCVTGRETWQRSWSPSRQAYCCRTTGFGCMVVPQPPQPGPVGPVDPFNCADGFGNWEADWSEEKKSWCCQHFQKGCADQAAMSEGQAANSGYGGGAKYGTGSAGIAQITGITPYAQLHGR